MDSVAPNVQSGLHKLRPLTDNASVQRVYVKTGIVNLKGKYSFPEPV